MKYLAVVVLLSFLALGVFGFAAMGHDAGCLARAISGAECPANSLSAAIYHAQVFLSFSLAVLVFIVLFLPALFFRVFLSSPALISVSRIRNSSFVICHSSLLRWLSFHEMSPPRG